MTTAEAPELALACTEATFRPVASTEVRWLDGDDDVPLLLRFHQGLRPDEPFTIDDQDEWRRQGFVDAGILVAGEVVARAALWQYSEKTWELAGVVTVPSHRGEGLSRSVCSFVTEAILRSGRIATCHSANPTMQRLALALGYVVFDPAVGPGA